MLGGDVLLRSEPVDVQSKTTFSGAVTIQTALALGKENAWTRHLFSAEMYSFGAPSCVLYIDSWRGQGHRVQRWEGQEAGVVV